MTDNKNPPMNLRAKCQTSGCHMNLRAKCCTSRRTCKLSSHFKTPPLGTKAGKHGHDSTESNHGYKKRRLGNSKAQCKKGKPTPDEKNNQFTNIVENNNSNKPKSSVEKAFASDCNVKTNPIRDDSDIENTESNIANPSTSNSPQVCSAQETCNKVIILSDSEDESVTHDNENLHNYLCSQDIKPEIHPTEIQKSSIIVISDSESDPENQLKTNQSGNQRITPNSESNGVIQASPINNTQNQKHGEENISDINNENFKGNSSKRPEKSVNNSDSNVQHQDLENYSTDSEFNNKSINNTNHAGNCENDDNNAQDQSSCYECSGNKHTLQKENDKNDKDQSSAGEIDEHDGDSNKYQSLNETHGNNTLYVDNQDNISVANSTNMTDYITDETNNVNNGHNQNSGTETADNENITSRTNNINNNQSETSTNNNENSEEQNTNETNNINNGDKHVEEQSSDGESSNINQQLIDDSSENEDSSEDQNRERFRARRGFGRSIVRLNRRILLFRRFFSSYVRDFNVTHSTVFQHGLIVSSLYYDRLYLFKRVACEALPCIRVTSNFRMPFGAPYSQTGQQPPPAAESSVKCFMVICPDERCRVEFSRYSFRFFLSVSISGISINPFDCNRLPLSLQQFRNGEESDSSSFSDD